MKPEAPDRALTPQERRLLFRTPARSKNLGYAAPPGSGPAGETCKSCAHYTHRENVAGNYRKCGLMRVVWTGGAGTDIKAGSPACAKWEKLSTPTTRFSEKEREFAEKVLAKLRARGLDASLERIMIIHRNPRYAERRKEFGIDE